MIKAKNFLILLLLGVFSSGQVIVGQESDNETKASPYDLLSSYYSDDFKPFQNKTWYLGAAFSLGTNKKTNTTGLLQNVVEGESHNYNISLKGGYYSGDYTMIGLNLKYFENGFTGTVVKESDTIQSSSITKGWAVLPNLRASIPLTPTERLSFFIAIGTSFGKSTSLDQEIKNLDQYTRLYSNTYEFALGFSPGLTFFAMENFAFELQLNVFGYNLSITESENTNQEPGRVVDQKLNFRIDLLTLELGLAYYFIPN